MFGRLILNSINEVDAFKLVVHESGGKAESRILLKAKSGSEITITAAAFPFMIAVNGVVGTAHIFDDQRIR